MDATTVAIDLAKDVFQVAVANRAGRVADRQRFTRRQSSDSSTRSSKTRT